MVTELIRLFKRPEVCFVAEHTHDFIEMVYIMGGEGIEKVEGIKRKVKRGDLLIYNTGEVHSLNSPGYIDAVNMNIFPDSLSEDSIGNASDAANILSLKTFRCFSNSISNVPPIVHFYGTQMVDIENIVTAMLNEYTNKQKGYKTIVSGYLYILTSLMFRTLEKQVHQENEENLGRITPEILDFIEKNYNRKLSITDLAKKSFYNPSYFARIFKECFGCSPTEYINNKRINRSMQLLLETDMSIEEISQSVGITDKKHFYNLFKEHTGITPGNYRKSKN